MAEEPGEAPGLDVPVGMFEDIEDLKAQLAQLTAQVKALTARAADGPGEASAEAEDAGGPASPEKAEDGGDDEEDGQYPPFILLLDPPELDDELRALTEWVEGVLVPGYLAEPSTEARWCHLWFEHPVAIARLHALWLAWQELTDPASCGYTGPSTWHRDHMDPALRELRGPTGPFAGCTKNEHQVMHRLPAKVPSAWTHGEN